MAVFFGVRPDAIAVLEVDPEVLDRLSRELADDAPANGFGKAHLVWCQAKGRSERWRVWRVLFEH